MTSRRSVIAEAPNTTSASLRVDSRASASRVALPRARRVSRATIARSRRREPRLEHAQRLGDDAGFRPGSSVETTPTRNGRNGATQTAPSGAAASAVASAAPDVANGMILTVATMSPAATGSIAGQRRHRDRLVDRIDPVDRVGVDDRKPGAVGEQIDAAGERRRARRFWPARRSASLSAASFSPTSPGSSRAAMTLFTPAGRGRAARA